MIASLKIKTLVHAGRWGSELEWPLTYALHIFNRRWGDWICSWFTLYLRKEVRKVVSNYHVQTLRCSEHVHTSASTQQRKNLIRKTNKNSLHMLFSDERSPPIHPGLRIIRAFFASASRHHRQATNTAENRAHQIRGMKEELFNYTHALSMDTLITASAAAFTILWLNMVWRSTGDIRNISTQLRSWRHANVVFFEAMRIGRGQLISSYE